MSLKHSVQSLHTIVKGGFFGGGGVICLRRTVQFQKNKKLGGVCRRSNLLTLVLGGGIKSLSVCRLFKCQARNVSKNSSRVSTRNNISKNNVKVFLGRESSSDPVVFCESKRIISRFVHAVTSSCALDICCSFFLRQVKQNEPLGRF